MPLTIKILLFLLIAPIVYLLRGLLFKKHGWLWFYILICVHGFVLTLATVSFLNSPLAILSDEVSVMNHKDYYQSNAKKEKAYEFVKNNFVLINTFFDKKLLPNPNETEGDSTYINITNREKLTRLLHILNNDSSNIDAVVCDIGFTDTTSYDSSLYNEMWKLNLKDKLLVSTSGEDKSIFTFPDDMKGDVKEETNEKLFVSHRLWREKYYSLPYQVYASLHHVTNTSPHFFNYFLRETYNDKKEKWVMNTFLPQFFITDESLFQNNLIEIKATDPLKGNDVASSETSSQLVRNLGASIKDDGEDLLDDLNQRKINGKKNIVFLGTFSGDEDLHKTAYTDLHGPVILLNLVYALEVNQNGLSFLFLLCLFIFYCIVTFALFNGILVKLYETGKNIYPELPTQKRLEKLEDSESKKTNGFIKAIMLFVEFIFFEEFHYFFLLILVLVIESVFGILVNGISLVFYLIAFEAFALHFGKSYLSSRNSLHHI